MNTTSEDATSESTMSHAARARRTDVRRLARRQVMSLSAQFLIGMAIALIGPPSENTGALRAATEVLLVLHVVVAITLVAVAIRIIRAARPSAGDTRRLVNWGAAMIGLTFGAGVLTAITKNNWWSYVMAVGFIASLLLYGSLLVRAQRPGEQR